MSQPCTYHAHRTLSAQPCTYHAHRTLKIWCRSLGRGRRKCRQTVPTAQLRGCTASSAPAEHGTERRRACARHGPVERLLRNSIRHCSQHDGVHGAPLHASWLHWLDLASPSVQRRSTPPAATKHRQCIQRSTQPSTLRGMVK